MGIYIKGCKDCEQRRADPPCHGTCPAYIAEKIVHDSRMQTERKRRSIAGGLNDQRIGGIEKAVKKRGRESKKGLKIQ